MATYGIVVSNALAAEDNVTSHSSPKHITPQVKDDDGEEQTDRINREGDKAAEDNNKKCDAACEKETAAKEDYIYDEPGKERPYPGDKDKKVGNDLTIILKLKYSNLPAKYFKKVEISVGKYFGKFYNLSDKPGKVTIKHLKIPEGRVFNVHINNYLTDEGEQVRMHNSVCKCPETKSIRVP